MEPPRVLIIGAGSRGNAYARAIKNASDARIVAVAEPLESQRRQFGKTYIWTDAKGPKEGQSFTDWKEYIHWEQERHARGARGEKVPDGVDAVFVCTLDETHVDILTALAPLKLHVLCEKPLATTLDDCLKIYRSLLEESGDDDEDGPSTIFSIGHVLRYSPHNMLLRKLLLEEHAIGNIVSVEHTEPVGWWHFAHSYVRGNWRQESTSAPSLLTKSCHDIDLLLWLLCSPPPGHPEARPHLPSSVMSTGSLVYFKPSSKPALAGTATNCLSCEAESQCMYSARKIYQQPLQRGNTGWPVKIVVPEIEDCLKQGGLPKAEEELTKRLAEDYDDQTPGHVIEGRPWFGRCVYEAGNDVCDDQFVTLTWDDDSDVSRTTPKGDHASVSQSNGESGPHPPRNMKRATFHMVAFTEAICERRSRFYGTRGELVADSRSIRVHDFATRATRSYQPEVPDGGHGGGDAGLARQFLRAVDAVKNQGWSVSDAQRVHVGCTLDEIMRSHAMVFAAEEARRTMRIVDWPRWWQAEVEQKLHRHGPVSNGRPMSGSGQQTNASA
ncbi:MAG: hypothetical protein M1823_000860 [Watsoniomyces obsoletus]|nr:MAG: hypothetical protein M1823_000860 [Watsoniomyces obsoletus]